MNTQGENGVGAASLGEADATLRLIAEVPAPVGLEDRVKGSLHRMPAGRGGRLLDWPGGSRRSWWLESAWARGAAAAAIVAVVAGGSWQVYSRVQPKQAHVLIPHVGTASGFASANAVRTPKTLDAPTVTTVATASSGSKKREDTKKRTMRHEPAERVRPPVR
ncbi:MAG TPA: hypothetical protein VHW46_08040 [Terracidiphilus sp.]|jgi:hypothetical protein|nr:hypothetical protein [Terracidiphilus sp.]